MKYTIDQILDIDEHIRQARFEGRRSISTQLGRWLQDNIEYEDYCILHGISGAAPYQRVCWYQVIEKIDEIMGKQE